METLQVDIPKDYRFIDMTSQQFSDWTVLYYAGKQRQSAMWMCRCKCGTEKLVKGSHLRANSSTSCGCSKLTGNLAGQQFGRWIVLRDIGIDKEQGAMCECRCACGTIRIVASTYLVTGHSRACGCVAREKLTKHGMCHSPEFMVWRKMIERCVSPNATGYDHYGGRGIKVCERWMESFTNFYDDMGPRPSRKYSIDRYPNNDGNYEPGNCRWATDIEQARNKKNNRRVNISGRMFCVSEIAELSGISPSAVASRIDRGWTGIKLLAQRKGT